MFGAEIAVAVVGGCFGLLGGWTAQKLFEKFSPDHLLKTTWCWKRSLLVGLLAGIAVLLAFASGEQGRVERLVGLSCLGASFFSVLLYILVWLKLLASYGPGVVEAGELSLLVTVILTALLYVSGLLWITLAILGGGVLLAMTVANGLWIYRLR